MRPISVDRKTIEQLAPAVLAGLAFVVLFQAPITTLVRDWFRDPEASHGLLLAPMAAWLAWKAGIREAVAPRPFWGLLILLACVALRYVSGLAAELFTMR